MHIDQHLSVLRLSSGGVQIGSGTRRVLVDASRPAVDRALRLLSRDPRSLGGAPRSVADVAGRSGLSLTETIALLRSLQPVLATAPERAGPRHVQIIGLGRTGMALACLLSLEGVTSLALEDAGVVGFQDLGSGYTAQDIGRERAESAVAVLQRLGQGTHAFVRRPRTGSPFTGELTAAVSRGAWDTEMVTRAVLADHPLLPVVLRDDDAVLGPVTGHPGAGCPLCWDLHAAAEDEDRHERVEILHAQAAGREPIGMAWRVAAAAAEIILGRANAAEPVWVTAAGQHRVAALPVAEACGCAAREGGSHAAVA